MWNGKFPGDKMKMADNITIAIITGDNANTHKKYRKK